MTHYDVLGVARDADGVEIRRAYLALARRHHPDAGSGSDAARMAEINAAWAVLGDSRRRADYDDGLGAVVTERPEPEPWQPYDTGDDPEPMPPEDLAPMTQSRRALTLSPAILVASGIGSLAAGLVSGFAPLLAFGIVCLVASAGAFVLLPVMTMFESIRDERSE